MLQWFGNILTHLNQLLLLMALLGTLYKKKNSWLEKTLFNGPSMIKLLGVIQKVRSLRRGGWIIEKRTKANSGWGSQHVCTFAFLKKTLGFSKWSFIVIIQFFLLIIMEDYNVQSCQWMACDRFRQSTQDRQCGLC